MRILSLLMISLLLFSGCGQPDGDVQMRGDVSSGTITDDSGNQTARRIFCDQIGIKWIGNGVSYGPFREGQYPGKGPFPTTEQLREDLHILVKHWQMIRLYATDEIAGTILQIIKDDELPMRVVVGTWIMPEAKYDDEGKLVEEYPHYVASNKTQVEQAIHFANQFRGIVSAVVIGNETMVSWSDHKVRPEVIIRLVREARSRTKVPVSTADDWLFWLSEESDAVVKEVDFILLHMYAMWTGVSLDDSIDWTRDIYKQVRERHPHMKIVIGETGWATMKHTEGYQANAIQGKPGEKEQKIFIDKYIEWTTENRIDNFLFEAFDEPWKGGEHPNEVEKHWGLFNADRTPKHVMKDR